MCIRYSSYIHQGGTKDSETAMWLTCSNCYSSPGPAAAFVTVHNFSFFFFFFFGYVNPKFLIYHSLILELGFCNSGETWEITGLLQDAGRGHGGKGLPQEGSIGSCLATIF